ncbi:uncharacterized protein LOC143298078 [Babylonia areolata]|uniref:uncharacterized protein LOC143298078 n=1 Tax=Babylonia areolata TaxID=304850 RepID=UPI003FD34213
MIPVVDIGVFVEAVEKGGAGEETVTLVQSQPEVKKIARLVHDAICQHGFCYLANHHLPRTVLDNVLASSKRFFELDEKVKALYARQGMNSHGYIGVEKEKLNESRPEADLKEAFNFCPGEGKELPTEIPDLDKDFKDMFHCCHVLAGRVLDLMGVALELEDPHLLSNSIRLAGHEGSFVTMRSLYYPPTTHLKEGQMQCSEHSDYGTITLLFQDDTGGLQILGKDDQYHDAPPVPGAVIVNVGDLLQRWTADKYPSTKHRVVVPPEAATQGRARQSLAFFCQPDHDTLITCLDGSDTYPPITSYDYVVGKIATTFY